MGLRPMEKTTLFRGSTYEAGQTKYGVLVLGLCTHSLWESNREGQSPQPGKHPHLQDSSSGGFQPQDTCSPSWGPNSFSPQDEAGLTRKFETSHVGGATSSRLRALP